MKAEFNGRIVDVIDFETGAYVTGDHAAAYTNPANLKPLPQFVIDQAIDLGAKKKRQPKAD